MSYNCTVIAYPMVCKEKICEIRTPLLVDRPSCKILLQPVIKYPVWFAMSISRFLWAYNGAQPQLRIHVFMDRCWAVAVTLPFQINFHAAVTIDAIVRMVDFLNLALYFCFMGIVIRLPVSPVVVVSIWTDLKPPEQPAQAKFRMMLFYKSISL